MIIYYNPNNFYSKTFNVRILQQNVMSIKFKFKICFGAVDAYLIPTEGKNNFYTFFFFLLHIIYCFRSKK